MEDIANLVQDGDLIVLSEDSTAILVDSENNVRVLCDSGRNELKIMKKENHELVEADISCIKLNPELLKPALNQKI
jgi:hypothetical protein